MEVISGLLANETYQLGGTFEDARALHVAWQVAPQRNDATHSGFLVQVEKPANALACALDARQVWGYLDAGLAPRLIRGLDGTRAGRASGAEGHRKERGSQRCQRPESYGEVFLSRGRLGRKQLDAKDLGVSVLALHELPSPRIGSAGHVRCPHYWPRPGGERSMYIPEVGAATVSRAYVTPWTTHRQATHSACSKTGIRACFVNT